MSTQNFRGITVPELNEDILVGIHDMADSVGAVRKVESVQEIKELLRLHPTMFSPAQPAYFDLHDTFYKAESPNELIPVGFAEPVVDRFTAGKKLTLTGRAFSPLITSRVTAAPIPRFVVAYGQAYGRVLEGRVNVKVKIRDGQSVQASRLSEDSGNTVSVQAAQLIPAGVAPNVVLGYEGDTVGRNIVQTPANEDFNTLVVVAYPVNINLA